MKFETIARYAITRSPGFSRWNACRGRDRCRASLIRLKPGLQI
jgi:hypothetical protein